jgi:tetratricopeptide (TPR) repeat protein
MVCLLATSAYADKAQKLVDEAAQLYEQADLAGALAKLEQAYEQSKRPDILFGIARIHVDRGNCAKAIDVYRAFLESKPKPGPRSTQVATQKIAECQKILATAEPPKPEPVPEPAPVPAPVVEPPRREQPPAAPRVVLRPWYTDVVGDVLVIGGLAGLGVGAYLFTAAGSDVDAANAGGAGGVTAAEYIALRDRADRRYMYATIGAGVGGALLIGGILKYAISDRTEVVPTRSGIALRGRF